MLCLVVGSIISLYIENIKYSLHIMPEKPGNGAEWRKNSYQIIFKRILPYIFVSTSVCRLDKYGDFLNVHK